MSEQPQPNIWITVDASSATRTQDYIRAFLPQPWDHGRDLPCDEHCVCPVHGTPLIYWPAGDDHACQDVDCRYGHGMKSADPNEEQTP